MVTRALACGRETETPLVLRLPGKPVRMLGARARQDVVGPRAASRLSGPATGCRRLAVRKRLEIRVGVGARRTVSLVDLGAGLKLPVGREVVAGMDLNVDVRGCRGGSLAVGDLGGGAGVRRKGRMGPWILSWMRSRIRIRLLGRSCWTS